MRRECDRQRLDFEPISAEKDANHCGLQLAGLVARPIGRHMMRPEQANRAYERLESEFRRSPQGKVQGWRLKRFP